MSGPPLPPMLVSPPKQVTRTGGTVHVVITDTGAVPLRVTTHAVLLNSGCAMAGTHDVSVVPATFVLKAHEVRSVAVTVNGPAGDYGVSFLSAAVKVTHHSGIGSAIAVGSRVITGTGTTACAVHHPHHAQASPAASSSGFPWVWVLIPVLVLGLGAVLWRTLRHRT